MLSDFKIYYKVTVIINTVRCRQKYRHKNEWSKIELLEIGLHRYICGQLIFLKIEMQSYLGTRQLQNSSNLVCVAFWQENYVPALGACLGLVTLPRTCMSHHTSLKEKISYGKSWFIARWLWHLSCVPEQINNEYQGTAVIVGSHAVLRNYTDKSQVLIISTSLHDNLLQNYSVTSLIKLHRFSSSIPPDFPTFTCVCV